MAERTESIADLVTARWQYQEPVEEDLLSPALVRSPRLLTAAILAVLLAAAAVSFRLGLVVAYNDAQSHLVIARRTFDSLEPGLAQLGTVWLPIPHLLLIPFVAVDGLYRTGLAGTVVGVLVTAYGAVSIYKLVHLWTGATVAAILGLAVYLLNPNLLYLQSTPLTEPVFLGFFAGAAYNLAAWMRSLSYRNLIAAGALTTLACLCRYDGWALAAVGSVAVLAVTLKRTGRGDAAQAMTISFGVLAGFGILIWFFFNFSIFGDPLAFQHGATSAAAQQQVLFDAGRLPARGHLGVALTTYSWDVIDICGRIATPLAAAGWLWTLIAARDRLLQVALLAVLLSPFLLNVTSMDLGQTVVQLPQTDGKGVYFNVRYALGTLPWIAVGIGLLASRLPRPAITVSVLLGLQAGLFLFQGAPIAVLDGISGLSRNDPTSQAVSGFLRARYTGGQILIDDSSGLPILFQSQLNLREFITTGAGNRWGAALEDPAGSARWIVFSPDDMVGRSIAADPRRLAGFAEAAHFEAVRIYERR